MGLPRWLKGEESSCHCRRREFDPWIGKIPWRRKWEATPVFLPEKFHGPRSLVGCSPWGCKDLYTTEQLSTHKYIGMYNVILDYVVMFFCNCSA